MLYTVGELRALLTNLPEETLFECDTEGDYDTYPYVTFQLPDDKEKRVALDDLQPGDTYHTYKARQEEKQKPGKDFAAFLDSLILTPEERDNTTTENDQ